MTADPHIWGPPDRSVELFARNISTRYLAIFIDGVIGLILLPFNVAHLGASAYGLWALATSVTWFFGVLDLGYGGALVKFIAQYRAWRDRQALNEVLSTVALVFAALGAVAFPIVLIVAVYFDTWFNVEPAQVPTARLVLIIVGTYLSIRFPFSIFGAVTYGFQRYYRNNAVSIATSVAVAAVNVTVLTAGYGLVELVAATTTVRTLSLGLFAWNAWRVYPGLRVSVSLFRRERLREVSGLSIYMFALDWSAKINYSSDPIVIGAILDTTAVGFWTVGQRLAQVAQQLTKQLNDALFPAVVDSDAAQRQDRLQMILVQGTKLSLGLAVPLCVGLILLAEPLVRRWVGPGFIASVVPAQILLMVVLVRIAGASANTILKGAGQHRLLTFTNAATAVVNVFLSILMIRSLGLVGVALGTLIPVATATVLVLYPAACRRVGLPLSKPLTEAFWPAVWPGAVMIAAVQLSELEPPSSLLGVAIRLGLGGLVYLILFVGVALRAEERRFYWSKLRTLFDRGRRPAVAA